MRLTHSYILSVRLTLTNSLHAGGHFSGPIVEVEFLTKVWGPQNNLLKSVLDDANNEFYISGCRALGLIDKFITGPLWKLLESNLHILDMST